jgi:hypothetical protein
MLSSHVLHKYDFNESYMLFQDSTAQNNYNTSYMKWLYSCSYPWSSHGRYIRIALERAWVEKRAKKKLLTVHRTHSFITFSQLQNSYGVEKTGEQRIMWNEPGMEHPKLEPESCKFSSGSNCYFLENEFPESM